MMTKFRKRPVVVQAFKWTGGPDQIEDPTWIVDAILDGRVSFEHEGTEDVKLLISTLEGVMRADVGDWIVKGVEGEIYPVKPLIFAATYEDAE